MDFYLFALLNFANAYSCLSIDERIEKLRRSLESSPPSSSLISSSNSYDPSLQYKYPSLRFSDPLEPKPPRSAKIFTGSSLPEDVQVGEIALGENRLLYTYVNSSGLITAAVLVVAGFALVAGALYLYDFFVLGGSSTDYNRNDEQYPDTNFDYYDSYGFDASRIRKRYVVKDFLFIEGKSLSTIRMIF